MNLIMRKGTSLMLLPVRQSPLQVLLLNCPGYVVTSRSTKRKLLCMWWGRRGRNQGGADIGRLHPIPIRGRVRLHRPGGGPGLIKSQPSANVRISSRGSFGQACWGLNRFKTFSPVVQISVPQCDVTNLCVRACDSLYVTSVECQAK